MGCPSLTRQSTDINIDIATGFNEQMKVDDLNGLQSALNNLPITLFNYPSSNSNTNQNKLLG